MPEIDYNAERQKLEAQFAAALEPLLIQYKKCVRAAFAANDQPDWFSDSPTMTLAEGVGVELILAPPDSTGYKVGDKWVRLGPPVETDLYKKLRAAIEKCKKGAQSAQLDQISAELDDLEHQAIASEQRAPRYILADESLRSSAEEYRILEPWPPAAASMPGDERTLLRVASGFKQLAKEFSADRFVNEFILLLPTKANTVRFGSKWMTLSALAAQFKKDVKLHVDDVVYLGASNWQSDPAGEEALRQLLGAGLVKVFEAPATSLALTRKCYGAYDTAGPGMKDALGLLAHAFVARDYERRMKGSRNETLFVDDQSRGPINPKYVWFLLWNNPNLDPVEKNVIRRGRYKRPDLVLHRANLREFEETKPHTPSGKKKGLEEVQQYTQWMTDRGLPYKAGTSYQANHTYPILQFMLAGLPVTVELEIQRGAPGLILYRYCFTTDWSKLVKGAVVAVFLVILAFLLRTVGNLPTPLPPIPRLPDKIPVPVLPPTPVPIPVPAYATNLTLSTELMDTFADLTEDQRQFMSDLVRADEF
jgi:hypothetical protein